MIVVAEADGPHALYERLSGRRDMFERAVVRQFGGTFSSADAEDLVSSALERVLVTSALPVTAAEESWFRRVVVNLALDELRSRNGRAGGRERGGALREVILLSELADHGQEPDDALADPSLVLEALHEPGLREEESRRTQQVLAGMEPEDVRLLMIRNVELPSTKGRAACAARAGITEEAWRHRYARAWRRFVDALASATPTPRCGPVRELLGQLDAGALKNGAGQDARGKVDAHILECSACHVFARESYRILVLSPGVPALGVGLEQVLDGPGAGSIADRPDVEGLLDQTRRIDHIVDHGSNFVSRNGEAITAGGAVGGGAGFLALLGGGAGGAFKALIVMCGISVTAAGICGGVVATINLLDGPPPKVAEASPTPTPRDTSPEPTATPRVAVNRTPAPRKRQPDSNNAAKAKPRSEKQPAATPSGSSGREFTPLPSDSQSQPAPVAAGGGGEFTP